MGSVTRRSHSDSVRREIPSPSEPITSASGPVQSAVSAFSPSSAAATTHNPARLSSSRARFKFFTRATRICANAPAAAFSQAGVRPAARRSGMITPCAPAHSPVRIMAPRLWGSVT